MVKRTARRPAASPICSSSWPRRADGRRLEGQIVGAALSVELDRDKARAWDQSSILLTVNLQEVEDKVPQGFDWEGAIWRG